MPRERFKTLTEQMFYILLCLNQECCGADILNQVRAMTQNSVTIGSGTLYDLLDAFVKEGFIQEVKTEGRRKRYCITAKGKEILQQEYQRLLRQKIHYETLFGKES